jgi:hypothetical protein
LSKTLQDYSRFFPRLRAAFAGVLLVQFLPNPEAHAGSTPSIPIVEKLEAIRKSGYPVSLPELEEWIGPGPPREENAALAWTNAFAAIVRVRGKIPILRQSPCAPLSADQLEYFLKDVASNSVALKWLHEAGRLWRSRYPLNRLSDDKMAEFEVRLADAALLLEGEAIVDVERKQPDAAIGSIEALAALGRSLETEPEALLLDRLGTLDTICESTERIFCQGRLNEGQLTRLKTLCHIEQTTEPVTRALVAQRCHIIYNFQHWRDRILRLLVLEEMTKSDSTDPLPPKRITQMANTFAAQKDEDFAFYLDAMEELIAASKLPYWRGSQVRDKVELRLKAQTGPVPGQRLIYSNERLPEGLSKEFAQTMSRLGVAETAISVELYRLAHSGELPADLDTMVPTEMPTVPTDPMTGQRLRFIKTADGYTISSVVDNGNGTSGSEGPHGATLQINR